MNPFAVQNSATLLHLELQISIHLTCFVKAFRAHASIWRCDLAFRPQSCGMTPCSIPISSSCRLTRRPPFTSARHADSIPSSRADVGWVRLAVHIDQSEAPVLNHFLAPECFDLQCHTARSTPRGHATCGVRVCVQGASPLHRWRGR